MTRTLIVMALFVAACNETLAQGVTRMIDRQRARDKRLSHYSLTLEQYGVVRINFQIENMDREFNAQRWGGKKYAHPNGFDKSLRTDSQGYGDAAFRFRERIDAFGQLTHIVRTRLPVDELPFAFPGLPSEIRLTNETGFEQSVTDPTASVFTVDKDHGILNFRRAFLEFCCGFGLTGPIPPDAQISERDLGNGLTECSGAMTIPFLGNGKFVAEIDSDEILRSVVFSKNSWTGAPVIHTVTTQGKFLAGADWIAKQGTLVRELPIEIAMKSAYRSPEIDDGYSVRVESMKIIQSHAEFHTLAAIDRIPAGTAVVDATHGQAKIPLIAGQSVPSHSRLRSWFFAINVVLCVGFAVFMWRRRLKSKTPCHTQET